MSHKNGAMLKCVKAIFACVLPSLTISSLRKRELVCFTLIYECVFIRVLMALPLGVIGWSVTYDCCIFWPYWLNCFRIKLL